MQNKTALILFDFEIPGMLRLCPHLRHQRSHFVMWPSNVRDHTWNGMNRPLHHVAQVVFRCPAITDSPYDLSHVRLAVIHEIYINTHSVELFIATFREMAPLTVSLNVWFHTTKDSHANVCMATRGGFTQWVSWIIFILVVARAASFTRGSLRHESM